MSRNPLISRAHGKMADATVNNQQEKPGVEEHSPSHLNRIFMSQIGSGLVRWFQGKKVLDFKLILKNIGVEGIHYYIVDGFITFDVPMVPEFASEAIIGTLSKSAIEWAIDTWLKVDSPKKFMDYVMKWGMSELISEVFHMVKGTILPPESGLSRIFG
jgi:hypothetical protein